MYLGTHFGIFSRTSIQELGIYIDYLVPLKLEWSGYLMIKVGAVIPLFGIFQQSLASFLHKTMKPFVSNEKSLKKPLYRKGSRILRIGVTNR